MSAKRKDKKGRVLRTGESQRKLHPDQPLPKITPHVFRHTFCTKMAHAGMDIKSLQYLMGHSDAGATMNVYTHATYDHAEDITAFFAGREAQVGMTHKHNAYTKFTPFARKVM